MSRVDAPRLCAGHYARFLILTYPAARGIHRDQIPIVAGGSAKRTSDRQRQPPNARVYANLYASFIV